MDGLSYDDYFKKLDEMAACLRGHWSDDQRVKALKVGIQMAKLLAETNQLKLYTKKHKVITELMDEFGQLVYIRIHSMANSTDPQHDLRGSTYSKNRLVSDDKQPHTSIVINQSDRQSEEQERLRRARELAKDTCRNWFLKVASIRELVPRFYTELAILKTCDILVQRSQHSYQKLKTTVEDRHLEEQLFAQSLKRLTKAAWGLGDPVVALHARAYLCRVASNRLIGWQEHRRQHNGKYCPESSETTSKREPNVLFELISMNIESCVTLAYNLDMSSILRISRDQNIESSSYFELVSIPIQSILNNITSKYDLYKQELEDVDVVDDDCAGNNNANFLNVAGAKVCGIYQNDDDMSENSHTDCGGRCREHLLSSIKDTKCVLDELLEKILDGIKKEKFPLFGRNLLLYSAFKGFPADVIACKGFSLMDVLKITYDPLWLNKSSQTTQDSNDTNANLTFLEPTIFLTLNSFLVSLNGSDMLETIDTPEMDQLKCSIVEFVDQIINKQLDNNVKRAEQYTSINVNYLRCFKSLLSFAHHHTQVENNLVDKLLTRFLVRIEQDRQYVNHYATLIDIIKILISNWTDLRQLTQLFGWKSFKKLYDLLRKDEHRLEASKWILETMRANNRLSDCRNKQQTMENTGQNCSDICDRPTINVILKLTSDINDSLSALMALDDLEHLSNLVIYFLDKIRISDYQEHLNFLSRCRSLVGNLNLALKYLVERVLKLPDEFRKVNKKRQLRQNFLNGCLAYAFITIPAINSTSSRLCLYLEGSRMALEQMSLSLADYFLKQVMINLIEQTKLSDEKHNAILLELESERNSQDSDRIKRATSMRQQPSKTKQLVDDANNVLHLILKFQDHIDLKHKLALTDLIKHSFSECPNLLQSLRLLRCVDDDDDGFDDEHSIEN